jgi:peptidoglycan hydrolase-like protein with peptidoglycan-binding domain
MPAIIHHSVGHQGRNDIVDVRVVQRLLNDDIAQASTPLKVDGLMGPKTLAAIKAFQARATGGSDGRFDPNGPAIKKLADQHIKNVISGLNPELLTMLKGMPLSASQPPALFLDAYWLLLRSA